MISERQKDVCREAVKHYGRRAQILKVAEELRELALECVLAADGQGDPARLVDERADVAIVLYQLDELLLPRTLEDTLVRVRIGEKIQRLERRIEDERRHQG